MKKRNAIKYGQYIECPHCKGKYWDTVDRACGIKVHRCYDCKKEYTILLEENEILKGNQIKVSGIFRARCPQCKTYEWYTTGGSGEGSRDYKCALCQQWYCVNFTRKKITMKNSKTKRGA